jgi:hypothetical protein
MKIQAQAITRPHLRARQMNLGKAKAQAQVHLKTHSIQIIAVAIPQTHRRQKFLRNLSVQTLALIP